MSLPVQLAPDLPGSIDRVVGRVDVLDPLLELLVAHGAGGGCWEAFLVGVVGGRDDLAVVLGACPADWLDAAEAVPVLVDERYERRPVELGHEETRRGLQDLVGPLQLGVLLQRLQPGGLLRGRPRALPRVDLLLLHPVPQSLAGADAESLSVTACKTAVSFG